jgi:uncharacterized protein
MTVRTATRLWFLGRLVARAQSFAARGEHARAFRWFLRAAQSGLPAAQYHLGHCYLHGHGVPPSRPFAMRWLQQAADNNSISAQVVLASLALQGGATDSTNALFSDPASNHCEPDWGKAEAWGRKAAAAGSIEAKALLGFIRYEGPEALRDHAAGEILYREAASAGFERAQAALGVILLRDDDIKRRHEAQYWLKRASNAGSSMAQFMLGLTAESGLDAEPDMVSAAMSYRSAAEAGYPPAQMRYGFALLYGRGVPVDPHAGETWLRKAAHAGQVQAAATLGSLYAQGGLLPKDVMQSEVWLERAADAGHPAAARALACILLGASVPDATRAIRLLQHAAAAGDADAARDLQRMLKPAAAY